MKLEIESEDEFYQKFHVIKSQESCCPQSRQAEGKIQLFDGHLTALYMSMNYVEAKEIKKVVDEIIRAYEGLK